jgi:hypothetical protein
MTTLQHLIDACETDLADAGNATFSAADIELWCRDAIGDYAQHFRIRKSASVAMAAGDHDYTLNVDDFLDVLTVEYPTGQDPPRYLKRRYFLRDDFYRSGGFYDIDPNRDETSGPTLYLSDSPAAGQSARILYSARLEPPALTTGVVPVPEEHEPLLRSYVVWRALKQLQHAEEAAPTSSSSLLMSQLAQNADRARRAYIDSLARAVFSQARSRIVSWTGQADETRRIY